MDEYPTGCPRCSYDWTAPLCGKNDTLPSISLSPSKSRLLNKNAFLSASKWVAVTNRVHTFIWTLLDHWTTVHCDKCPVCYCSCVHMSLGWAAQWALCLWPVCWKRLVTDLRLSAQIWRSVFGVERARGQPAPACVRGWLTGGTGGGGCLHLALACAPGCAADAWLTGVCGECDLFAGFFYLFIFSSTVANNWRAYRLELASSAATRHSKFSWSQQTDYYSDGAHLFAPQALAHVSLIPR